MSQRLGVQLAPAVRNRYWLVDMGDELGLS